MLGAYGTATVASATTTFDVHNAGVFQLDGNVCNDAPSVPPWDWGNLNCDGSALRANPVGLFNANFTQAMTTGATGNSSIGPAELRNSIICDDSQATTTCPFASDVAFVTGGSKDGINPQTGWQCTTKPVTPKDEIDNAYAAEYVAPVSSGGPLHKLLYVAIERGITNGTSNAGFWLTQNGLSCPTGGGNFTGNHANGDLLIFATFNSGGAICPNGATSTACVDAFTWSGGASGSLQSAPVEGGVACGATAASFCGSVNTTSVQTPWGPHNTAANAIPANGFFEVGIDLTDFYNSLNQQVPCLNTFLADTRASGSQGNAVSSDLHDFISGSFPTCFPKTTLTKTVSAVNGVAPATSNNVTVHTNDNVTYTYTEANTGLDSLTNVYVTDDTCHLPTSVLTSETNYNVGDSNQNGALDPGETWTFTCTTKYTATGSVTNTAIAHGSDASLNVDDTWCANPTSPPSGVRCDQTERAQATVNVINPLTILSKSVTAVNGGPPQVVGNPALPTIENGASVTYTYTEQNPAGTGAPLSNVGISDDKCSSPAPTTTSAGFNIGDVNKNGLLDPGETWTFTCTTIISIAAAANNVAPTVTNTAVGTGTDNLGFTVTGNCISSGTTICETTEVATATVRVLHPSTLLTKSISAVNNGTPQTVSTGEVTVHQGDTVTYQYTEQNTGDSAISSPSVTDNLCGVAAYSSGDNGNGVLDIGETWTFTCSMVLNNAQSGTNPVQVTNTAIGNGLDALGNHVTYCSSGTSPASTVCSSGEQSSATLQVIHPSTSLNKTVTATITYNFTETNTGDVPLSAPSVTDTNTDTGTSCSPTQVVNAAGKNTGDTNQDGVFDPGETWNFQCQVTVGPTTSYSNTDTGVGSATDPIGSNVTWCQNPAVPPSGTVCSQNETASRTIKIS